MEWIKKNIALVFCFVGIAVLLMFLLKECEHNKELEDEVNTVNAFLDIEKQSSFDRDSIHAHDIKEMEQNLLTETSARILLEEEFQRFKKIQSHTRFESTSGIREVLVPFEVHDTVIQIVNNYVDAIPVDTVKKYFIQIPKIAKLDTSDWFQLYTTIDTALTIDSLFFINKFDVTIGYKKPDKPFKFLRKKVPTVELISYSPYTTLNYVNNITVKGKPGTPIEEILSAAGGGVLGFFIGRGTK